MTEAASDPAADVGRQDELAKILEYANRARGAEPWMLAVVGEPGIGKTTLLRRALKRLDDYTILQAVCAPAESDFAYGVIDQLIRRVDPGLLERLPLLREGLSHPSAAPYAVGVEFLELLGELQSAGPVAVVVDDAHWADRPSTLALGFVLRRLWADRFLAVLASRPQQSVTDDDAITVLLQAADHVAKLRLDGLSTDEVDGMLQQMKVPNSANIAKRLHAHTGGHPLWVRSVLAQMPPAALTPGRRLPVPTTLAEAVVAQLAQLPPPTRALLETLAVWGTRMPLGRAAGLAGEPDAASALEPALKADLVRWWPGEPSTPVEIRHSLLQEAIYSTIPPARRRQLHAAAALLADETGAWRHKVAAAEATDTALAHELEQTAGTEAAQGNNALAATHLLWAAKLSATAAEHERLLLTACLQSLLTTRPQWALELKPQIDACRHTALRSSVLGIIAVLQGRIPEAEADLETAVAQAGADPAQTWIAAVAWTFLAALHIWNGNGAKARDAAAHALSLGLPDPSMADYVSTLAVIGRFLIDGPHRALEDLTHLPPRSISVSEGNLDSLALRGILRVMLGEFTSAVEDLSFVVRREQAGASLRLGEFARSYLVLAHYFKGEWDDATIAAECALSSVAAQEQLWNEADARLAAVAVAAGRGDWTAASEHLKTLRRLAQVPGTKVEVLCSVLAEAIVGQARSDPQQMLAALTSEAMAEAEAIKQELMLWRESLLVEALIGCSRTAEARQSLETLQVTAGHVGYMRVVQARLWGMLAEAEGDLEQARLSYTEGLQDAPIRDDAPLYRALLHHALGRLLLRLRERREATEHLRTAHEILVALEARPFLDRCASDLEASGLHAPKGTPADLLALTERELSIARLVARGLTNQEAARELFVSNKTIEYHLSRIYSKLGLSSRKELRNRLSTDGLPATAWSENNV